MDGVKGRRKRKPQIKWTQERLDFLRRVYPSHSLRELTSAFNKQFACSVSEKAVGFQLSAHQIKKTPQESPAAT